MNLWGWLFTVAGDPWAAVKAWRARREKLIREAGNKHQPTVDAYPALPDPPPLIALYVEGRDARGRLLREFVDMDGYSLHQLNLRVSRRRDFLIDRILEAEIALAHRLDIEREAKKRRETE